MLEKILRLYVCAMAGEVRSPMPHLFGPPGAGKSSVVQEAANLLGVQLRIINLARVSPLEVEGIQMPNAKTKDVDQYLSSYWAGLNDGDIVMFDEFLRAFPETYNGTLDIMTSGQVGRHKLPNLFMIGASNSTVAYDAALEDRLLHIDVPDIRRDKAAEKEVRERFVRELGLMPEMANSAEMDALLASEVFPTYGILDQRGRATSAQPMKGKSLRHLKGQALLREFDSPTLKALIEMNNMRVSATEEYKYMFLMSGQSVAPKYAAMAEGLSKNQKLDPILRRNAEVNYQLIAGADARIKKIKLKEDEDAALAFS